MERALNGYATNLNDPNGDTCTVDETRGSRTFGDGAAAATTQVPYTSGAGGGAGAVVNGWVGAGNGCYFFNPFSSAIERNVFSGQVNNIGRDAASGTLGQVGFAGGSAVGGTTPDQQGYGIGYGLANDPGVILWLYENRRQKTSSDYYLIDANLNGQTGIKLPGGPINFAVGGQYRLTERKTRYAQLNNTEEFRCTFANRFDVPARPTTSIRRHLPRVELAVAACSPTDGSRVSPANGPRPSPPPSSNWRSPSTSGSTPPSPAAMR